MSAQTSGKKLLTWTALLLFVFPPAAGYLAAVSALAQNSQTGDDEWTAAVADPAYDSGRGPVVMVDAGHGNFHTIDGRYAAFAALLRQDGFRIDSADSPVTADSLRRADVFVISNALHGGDDAAWSLPTPPAFTASEIDAIDAWVANGGALLLIADHMPFPGATAALADRFGIVFLNGYALGNEPGAGPFRFTRAAGSLADHPISNGRSAGEAVDSVASFTGQAFRIVGRAQPLMIMPDDWYVLLPTDAGEFSERTPVVSARGLVQAAVLRHGKGRVAVFGEAAMFTAQTSVRDGVAYPMGLNHPAAGENAQFVLNVLHWLSGILDP